MKKIIIMSVIALSAVLTSCSNKLKELSNGSKIDPKIEGEWELTYITGPRITFDGLYPNRKPALNFNLKDAKISGNTSCNSLTGEIKADGQKIDFKKGLATTKMFCEGTGEYTFLKMLDQVETYTIKDNVLSFSSSLGEIMKFKKK
ncbi:META domain-containing protein [Pseudopedobacter beijingensis]|uniref:META domain-containing protein n=1 Tax=Pseudopedobacter beijingensis TaxID=1207056 RepID=A0ABW4ICY9_9SPHI